MFGATQTLESSTPGILLSRDYKFSDLLIKSLGRFHHHHMAGIGEDFQLRAFDPAMEEFGIKDGRERIILSADDKCRKINLLDFVHHIKSVTG